MWYLMDYWLALILVNHLYLILLECLLKIKNTLILPTALSWPEQGLLALLIVPGDWLWVEPSALATVGRPERWVCSPDGRGDAGSGVAFAVGCDRLYLFYEVCGRGFGNTGWERVDWSTLKPSRRSCTILCDGFFLLMHWCLLHLWIDIPALLALARNYHDIFCVVDKSRNILKIHLGLALTQKSYILRGYHLEWHCLKVHLYLLLLSQNVPQLATMIRCARHLKASIHLWVETSLILGSHWPIFPSIVLVQLVLTRWAEICSSSIIHPLLGLF